MRRRPFYGLAALALGTALTVAGCAGDGGSSSSASPAATTTASSAAGGKAENAALTADTFATRLADAQKAKKSVQLSMTTTMAGQKVGVEGKVDLGGSKVAMDETVTMPGVMPEMTIRAVDGVIYMNMGKLSKNKWIEVDPSDTSDPLASQFTGMLDGADPTQQLEGLKGAITSLEKSGSPEKVDGVDAQKYVLTVDTTKLGGALKSQVGAAGASLPKTITYTYWVDSDDLMRKVEADVAGAKVEMHFSHWGEPVTITAPPKSDILPGGIEDLTALES
ncbi:LppX_LprAFG lipoprotein [Luteimicrobium sp. NPDC057192]|uniref:LppX_LprAFG lipoprotein n=1 Tax=Luteimicrobium sp. NPDC057192 TaxID=3346042 RepID=UPI0036270C4B